MEICAPEAYRRGHRVALLNYVLSCDMQLASRLSEVLDVALKAAKPEVACWLVHNCQAYLTPSIISGMVPKLASQGSREIIDCLLSLKLEMYPGAPPCKSLVLATAVAAAARSAKAICTELLLKALSAQHTGMSHRAHAMAASIAAHGGHVHVLRAVLASASKTGAFAEPTTRAQQCLDTMLVSARANVLRVSAEWALETLGADGIAPYRPLLAHRALLGNRPALAVRLLGAGKRAASEAAASCSGPYPQFWTEALRSASAGFLGALGNNERVVPCAASWAFAQQHLPDADFDIRCRAAIQRCCTNDTHTELLRFILSTEAALGTLCGDAAFVRRLIDRCAQVGNAGGLTLLLGTAHSPELGVHTSGIFSAHYLQALAVGACTGGDRHRVLAAVLLYLPSAVDLKQEQVSAEQSGGAAASTHHNGILVRLFRAILCQHATGCLHTLCRVWPAPQQLWPPLLDACVEKWAKIEQRKEASHAEMRVWVQVLRLGHSHAGLQLALEASACRIPWKELLAPCLRFWHEGEHNVRVLLGISGVLKNALICTPGIMSHSMHACGRPSTQQAEAVLDFLWDAASAGERDDVIRRVLSSGYICTGDTCALLDRISAPSPLQTFSSKQLEGAVDAAVAAGDEAFVRRMADSGVLSRILQWETRCKMSTRLLVCRTWLCDSGRALRLVDLLWSNVDESERNKGMKHLISRRSVLPGVRCTLLARMSGLSPLDSFCSDDVMAALDGACASGDEAFVQRVLDSRVLDTMQRAVDADSIVKYLIIGGVQGFGAETQRIAGRLLEALSEQQAQLGAVILQAITKQMIQRSNRIKWLLLAVFVYYSSSASPRPPLAAWTSLAAEHAVANPQFVHDPWRSSLPDLFACKAGHHDGARILQACLGRCAEPRRIVVQRVYRRVQWQGRRELCTPGRRAVLLLRIRLRAMHTA